MSLPIKINLQRLREDTYAEVFRIYPMPAGATLELEVDGLDTVAGVVSGNDASFDISSGIALGTVGSYLYTVVMTVGGLTRTIIQGIWQIKPRPL